MSRGSRTLKRLAPFLLSPVMELACCGWRVQKEYSWQLDVIAQRASSSSVLLRNGRLARLHFICQALRDPEEEGNIPSEKPASLAIVRDVFTRSGCRWGR